MNRRRFLQSAVVGSLVISVRDTGTLAQDSTPPAGSSTPEPAPTSPIQFVARPADGADGERFSTELEPGGSATLALVLENFGADPINLHTYTANVGLAPNGGMKLSLETEELIPPATWLALEAVTHQLAPGQMVEIPFTVTVPADTGPGEYVNAVAVETVDSFEIEGSENFRQRVRKILAVYVYVPGDMHAELVLGEPVVELRNRGAVIQVPIENVGNSRAQATGTAIVTDSSGTELFLIPIGLGWIYGGMNTVIELSMPSILPEGEYLLNLELKLFESETTVTLEDAAFVMPNSEVLDNPVQLGIVTIEPNADPVQFANVTVEIVNTEAQVQGAKVTLGVFKDDVHVEDFVLVESLALNQGQTFIQQRYIPITGFGSGIYTFSIRVEAVDPNTGTQALILSAEDVATMEVP